MSPEEKSKLIEAWNAAPELPLPEEMSGAQLCDAIIETLQEIKAGFGSEHTLHVTVADDLYGSFDCLQFYSRYLWERVEIHHNYDGGGRS